MDLKAFSARLRRLGRRPEAKAPPAPEAVKRTMLAQALIDGLLQISGPLARPVGLGLERLWVEALRHPSLSRAAGWLADQPLPRPALDRIIEAWVKAYDVDMSIADVPPEGYPTLDAFFTRRLVAGARPIDHDPDMVVSPADSVLKSLGHVDARARIPEVKARTYSVAQLLGGAMSEAPFIGGLYGVYYLSPRDYHRVHSPLAAEVRSVTALPGASYPVNARGVRLVEGLFVKNKRTVFTLDTDLGEVALVMVGATNVGRITASVAPGERIEKGQELGIFHLGSTVVLLTPASAGLAYHRVHEGEWLRVGQAVMTRAPRGC